VEWLEVSVTVDGEAAEAVADFLRPFAYGEGVVLEQLGDNSSPDPEALFAEMTARIYLPGDADSPGLRRRIQEGLYHMGRLYPIPEPVFRRLADEDWATSWREQFRPFRIGHRMWISPSWLTEDLPADDSLVLVLDPGMAFGTGTHPTTRLCLQALEETLSPGLAVLDVGTGSGILAIGAARLGAARVLALDVDGVAARTALGNAALNGVGGHIDVFHGSLNAVGTSRWDIVLVNILAPIIIELLDHQHLMDYVGVNGHLILSGIIETQEADVRGALERNGGVMETVQREGDWVCLVATWKSKTP
jgi:ribosomal protein L11 methyltransferase